MEKRSLTGEESISYLAAACHQGDYARLAVTAQPPVGRWVAAAEWKVLLRPDRALCLGEIARDLAREDIHPPLYFWLLHAWALLFGVGLWTGPSLNIAIAGLTTLALFEPASPPLELSRRARELLDILVAFEGSRGALRRGASGGRRWCRSVRIRLAAHALRELMDDLELEAGSRGRAPSPRRRGGERAPAA